MCGLLRMGAMLHQMEDATAATETLTESDARALAATLQRAVGQQLNAHPPDVHHAEADTAQPAESSPPPDETVSPFRPERKP